MIFSSGIKIIAIFLSALILNKFLHRFSLGTFSSSRRYRENEEYKKRIDTLNSILHYIICVGILVLAVVNCDMSVLARSG